MGNTDIAGLLAPQYSSPEPTDAESAVSLLLAALDAARAAGLALLAGGIETAIEDATEAGEIA